MIELLQRIVERLVVFDAVAEDVECEIYGISERAFVSHVLACDVVSRAVVGRCAHDRQSGCEVYAVAEIETLERSQALVVIHCQYAVECSVALMSEEAVGCVWSEGTYALSLIHI